ncbi:hypothetical protein Hanom_Chr07g00609841 [Helianthus anomalus]
MTILSIHHRPITTACLRKRFGLARLSQYHRGGASATFTYWLIQFKGRSTWWGAGWFYRSD